MRSTVTESSAWNSPAARPHRNARRRRDSLVEGSASVVGETVRDAGTIDAVAARSEPRAPSHLGRWSLSKRTSPSRKRSRTTSPHEPAVESRIAAPCLLGDSHSRRWICSARSHSLNRRGRLSLDREEVEMARRRRRVCNTQHEFVARDRIASGVIRRVCRGCSAVSLAATSEVVTKPRWAPPWAGPGAAREESLGLSGDGA